MEQENPASAREVNKYKEFARRVIEHHFGTRPKRLEHKAAGLSNFVFLAQHAEGKFIVRISPDAGTINAFIKEQWSQLAAKKAGVPTAEILEVGVSVIPHPYMITRNVDGQPAKTHPDRPGIARQMGEIAAKINSVRTHGFGATFEWSNNLLSLNNSWKGYLENEYRYQDKLERLEKRSLLPKDEARDIERIFRDAARLKPKPTLCHGDIRLKNVIVDEEGKIAAILDWEKATSNLSPQWELSLALHDLGIDEMQSLVEGYGITRRKLLDAIPLIKAFNILNYTAEVDRAVAEKDKPGLERVRLRLKGVFDLYSTRR
jgi:aminoglycoside phosphotransferase (APT) family kinase protein